MAREYYWVWILYTVKETYGRAMHLTDIENTLNMIDSVPCVLNSQSFLYGFHSLKSNCPYIDTGNRWFDMHINCDFYFE